MQRGSPQASRTLQTVQRAIGNVATLVRWAEAKLRPSYAMVASRVRALHHFAGHQNGEWGGGDAGGDVAGCPLLFVVTPVHASAEAAEASARRPSLSVAAASSAIAEARGWTFLAPEVCGVCSVCNGRSSHRRYAACVACVTDVPRTGGMRRV